MKYAVDGAMSKYIDRYTIERIGVDSLVLMERAALAVAEKTAQVAAAFKRAVRICAVCGIGNNGADGVAAARILTWQGLNVDIITVGDEGKATPEMKKQLDIARNSGIIFAKRESIPEYDIVIDALFGIGLSREISGDFALTVNLMNQSHNVIISVDIPSGIDAGSGNVHGVAVMANATVTFGYNKMGIMLKNGREYAGEVTVADIGFCRDAIKDLKPAMYFTLEDVNGIPHRNPDSNKGTYLRTLIIAGNEDMSGAAYLSAAAAYRCGCGLVEIFTHARNAGVIRSLLPEAIVTGYDDDAWKDGLQASLKRADTVIIGPGLGTGILSDKIVQYTMAECKVPMIIDADAINLLAKNKNMIDECSAPMILTPHVAEASRLFGVDKEKVMADPVGTARDFIGTRNIVCLVKDSVTVAICGESGLYINNSGCAAMSKGGMGDVLTGVIAGMLALRLEPFSAAAMGVYVHGLAGEFAAEHRGEHGVLASDLIEELGRWENYVS